MERREIIKQKVQQIFQRFDFNKDGGLNSEELTALMVSVNPRVKFSEEQIQAILDEVYRTYGEFIDGDEGLTYDGLLRTYDDGAGDVDRDFDALGLELELNSNINKEIPIIPESSSSLDPTTSTNNTVDQYIVPEEVESAGFRICADELTSIVEGHDVVKLKNHGGVMGIAHKLSTSLADGISTSEDLLKKRRDIYGENKFIESPELGFLVFLWEAFQDRVLILLAACAFISIVVGIAIKGWPNGALDGFGIITCILLVVFTAAQIDYQQYLQFKDLDKERKKILVPVTRMGLRQKVSIYELVPGDIVHISIGGQVPADGLFVSGFSLLINDSILTGHNLLIQVNAKNPFLLSGTKVHDGSCKMLVTSVGMRTQRGKQMAILNEEGQDLDETPLQVKLNGVATIVGKIGLYFAVMTFGILFSRKLQAGIWSGDDSIAMLEFLTVSIAIVVVAVPEGLPLAMTFGLACSMKKMKAHFRHLAACETMGSVTTICTHKTGILTTNHMTVVKACFCGENKEVSFLNSSTLNFWSGNKHSALRILLESIFNNTGGEIVVNADNKVDILGSPTETAVLEFGLLLGGNYREERERVKIVKVEPFNTTKKRMRSVLELPKVGFRAHLKGAAEIILASCDKFINADGRVAPLDEASINHLKTTIEQFSSEALQTLCFAYLDIGREFSAKNSIPFKGYTCIGIAGIKNPVREGIKESVLICRSAGIAVRMITGENITTAKAIARECGILTDNGIAIEGPELQEKSEKELLELIPKIQVIARISSPFDKHTLVRHLRKSFGEVVAVTGDAVTDASILYEANIGLAMGIAGTEVTKERADVVIMDDNFSTIVALVKWGRSIHINVRKLIQFQLTVIIVTLTVNFSAACVIGETPLTAFQLLWANMLVDILGAFGLVTEPPEDDLMKRSTVAVGRKEKLISNVMWRNILGQLIYQFLIIWYIQIKGKEIFKLEGSGSDLILNTLIFNAFVFCQVFNGISSREIEKVNVFRGILKNNLFAAVLTCTILFQIAIIEFLGSLANAYPLSWQQWFFTIFLGFLGMLIAAATKMIPAL